MSTDPTPAPAWVDVYVRIRNVLREGVRTEEVAEGVHIDWRTDSKGVERVVGVEVIGARGVEVDGLDVRTGRPHGVGPAVGGAGTATPTDPAELIRRLSSSLQDLIEHSEDPGTEALAAVWEGRQYAQTGAVYTDVRPRNLLVNAAVAAYAAAHQVPVNRITEGDGDGIEAVRAALAAATPGEPSPPAEALDPRLPASMQRNVDFGFAADERAIEDELGNGWLLCARPKCGLEIVRPGKVQCWCDTRDGYLYASPAPASTPHADRVETAARVLHDRRHRFGTAPTCGACRDDATAVAAVLTPTSETGETR